MRRKFGVTGDENWTANILPIDGSLCGSRKQVYVSGVFFQGSTRIAIYFRGSARLLRMKNALDCEVEFRNVTENINEISRISDDLNLTVNFMQSIINLTRVIAVHNVSCLTMSYFKFMIDAR